MTPRGQRLLYIDSGAGLAAGLCMLVLSPWLAHLYNLDDAIVVFMGIANLSYGAYSGALATWARRTGNVTRWAVNALVAANAIWSAVCVLLLASTWATISVVGIAFITLEALFVGALAWIESKVLRPWATR